MDIFGFHDGHACGYYRMQLPLAELARHGHNVETHCGWIERCKDFPIVVGQRVSKSEALPLWRRLAQPGRRLVWETDDDLWNIDPVNASAWLSYNTDVLDAAGFAASVADIATVSTDRLAEVVSHYNPNVRVLPNHIDDALLSVERPRRDRITIGWAGGDSHLRDIGMVADTLKRFLRRNPTVDFHNIGTSYLRVFGLRGRDSPWSQDIWDYYRALDFDIGIAPLADTEFNASKSGIKAIEYGALGIPVVASDLAPYQGVVIDGVTGYLVRHEHEWGKRLYELANDAAMREEMGGRARDHVAQWTIQRGWRRWESAYAALS